ncbi:hypothetical protein HDV05_007141 [Chytridiales sp. JEL 0842]|nr:hypothetical protein HDV05_007141 [Chytridiales sp. JEL 0842]
MSTTVNTSSLDYHRGEANGIESIFFYGVIMGCTAQCLMQTSFLRLGKGFLDIRTLIYIGLLIAFCISLGRSIFMITSGTQTTSYTYFDLAVDHLYVFSRLIAFYAAFVRVNAFLGNSYAKVKYLSMTLIGLTILATRIADRAIGLYFVVNSKDTRKSFYKPIRLNLKFASLWMFLISVFIMNVTLVYYLFVHVRQMAKENNGKAIKRIQEVLIAVGLEIIMLCYLIFDTSTDMAETPDVVNLSGATDVTIAVILCNLFRFGASVNAILNGQSSTNHDSGGPGATTEMDASHLNTGAKSRDAKSGNHIV